MVPTVPDDSYFETQPLPGGQTLQVTEFPADIYVQSVPTDQDGDGNPDTEVFVPVEVVNGKVTLQPGEEYVLITTGEPTTPSGGASTVDDEVDKLADSVRPLPVGNSDLQIFKTPDNFPPTTVSVGPNQVILKKQKPEAPTDNAPVDSFGPTLVTITTRPSSQEPTEFVYCEKPSTATPSTTATQITSGPSTPGTTGPVTPGTTGPATPGTTGPATPGTTQPATPGTTGPATPGTTRPATPGTTRPATPGTTRPATPGTSGSATPGTTGPATPGTTGPATPGTAPATPGTTGPATPGTSGPATPGTTRPATPSTTGPATPGTTAPATPGTTAPETPGTTRPATPGTTGPATPGTTGPETPGTTKPATPGTTGPATPGTSGPTTPGTTGPATPGTTGPATPGTTGPATPGTSGPATPGTTGPATPGTSGPATPGTTGPATPGTTVPATPGTTGPATPGTSGPATPGTTGPATPGTTAPITPGTTAPATPGTTRPTPGTTGPVTPGTTGPSTPATPGTTRPVTPGTTAPQGTVCSGEMVPTVPDDSYFETRPLPGGQTLQVTEFPADTYVQSVPTDQDGDGNPDTEVFVPVEVVNGEVTLQPGEEYVLITTGEPTTPSGGAPAVDDEVDKLEDSIRPLPVGDSDVQIFKTPDDFPPTTVSVGPNQVILKKQKPEAPTDNAPVDSFGPTLVTITTRPSSQEPTEFVYCEKPSTGTPGTTATPTTSGPATPGTTGPATPGTTGPATPGTTGPATPSTTGPATPGTTRPATPGTTGPATPGTTRPATPATTGPATPGTTAPSVCAEDMNESTLDSFSVEDVTNSGANDNRVQPTSSARFTFEVVLKEPGVSGELRSITLNVGEDVKRVVVAVFDYNQPQPVTRKVNDNVPEGEFIVSFGEDITGFRFFITVEPYAGSLPTVEVVGVLACIEPTPSTTATPSTTGPATPGTTRPATPGTTRPATPSTTGPATPGTTAPSVCSEDMNESTLDSFTVEDVTNSGANDNRVQPTSSARFTFEVVLKEPGVSGELRSITLNVGEDVKRVVVAVFDYDQPQPVTRKVTDNVPQGEFTVTFGEDVTGVRFFVTIEPYTGSLPTVEVVGVLACVEPTPTEATTTVAPVSESSPAPQPTTALVTTTGPAEETTTGPIEETTATPTTAGTPATIPQERCDNLAPMNSYLLTRDSIQVEPSGGIGTVNENGLVLTYQSPDSGTVVVRIYMPVGGTLEVAQIRGDFVNYQLELPTEGEPSAASSFGGKTEFGPDTFVTFSQDFDEGFLVFIFQVAPNSAGTITFAKLTACTLPKEHLCLISKDTVEAQLGFRLAGNAFGVTPDGQEVDFGPLVYLTKDVIIKGYCYECECKGNNTLECMKQNCEECPALGPWSECDVECGAGQRTRTADEIGVRDDCNTTETQDCFSECPTTQPPCLGSWTNWSPCEGCVQRRTRECLPECQDAGTCPDDPTRTLETRACPCTTPSTTPKSTLECAEGEMFGCLTFRESCMETCMAYRAGNNNTCIERDNTETECGCYCEPGKYRNNKGECVPQAECNCYMQDGTPVVIGYTHYPTACYKCICSDEGETCSHDDQCCEVGHWEDWSDCSVTCGPGVKTRTRVVTGNCNDIPDKETEVCNIPCECEDGETRFFEETCEEAVCIMGQFEVNAIVCEEIEYECNNDTHVMIEDPDRPCCQKCVEIKKPCRPVAVETIRLNYTDPVLQTVCISKPVSISRCEGSCADSSQTMQYMYDAGRFELVKEPGSCKCCQPKVVFKDVDFDCNGVTGPKKSIPQIESCECMQCEGGK